MLYICPTPIGNLEDITLRVIRILKEVDLIAAEDTRHTRKLLSHYDIHTPLTSYHEHNRRQKGEYLLNELMSGKKIALVSDAGMPGISDPGEDLVGLALAQGVAVVPLPGPNAGLTALVASGLPAGRFCFEGFLSNAKKERRLKLEELKREKRTVILYEAPHRLLATLRELQEALGDRPVVLARELTKRYEEFWRGTLKGAVMYFASNQPRGEFCLVLGGLPEDAKIPFEEDAEWQSLSVVEHVSQLEAAGKERKQAIKEVARLRVLPRREVYNAVVRQQEDRC